MSHNSEDLTIRRDNPIAAPLDCQPSVWTDRQVTKIAR